MVEPKTKIQPVASSPPLAGRSARRDYPVLGGLLEIDPGQILYLSRKRGVTTKYPDDIGLVAGFTDFSIKRWRLGEVAATLQARRGVLDEFRRLCDHLLDNHRFWAADETGNILNRQQHIFNSVAVSYFQPIGGSIGIVLRTPRGAIMLGEDKLRPDLHFANNCNANYFDVVRMLKWQGHDPLVCPMTYKSEQQAREVIGEAKAAGAGEEDMKVQLANAILKYCAPVSASHADEHYEQACLEARNNLARFMTAHSNAGAALRS